MKEVYASVYINEFIDKEVFASAVITDSENGSRLEYQDTTYVPSSKSDKDAIHEALQWALRVLDVREGTLNYTALPGSNLESIYSYPNVQLKEIPGAVNESFSLLRQPVRTRLGLLEA